MSAVVYADFTCPSCYLASLRVDQLLAAGRPAPDWRAVEQRPQLPWKGIRLGLDARRVRDQHLDAVRSDLRSGEELPERAPVLLPSTHASLVAYAEAYEAGVADSVRRVLFHAYWEAGLDIGDPEVLRRLLPDCFSEGRRTSDAVHDFGYAVTSQRGPLTTAAHRRLRGWGEEWNALGAPVALALVDGDTVLTGRGAVERLAHEEMAVG